MRVLGPVLFVLLLPLLAVTFLAALVHDAALAVLLGVERALDRLGL